MATQSVSTIQTKQVLDSTHFLQVCSGPVKIFNIEGNVNSTTGNSYYIQLLGVSQTAAVSGTTVPLYSRLAVQSNQGSGVNGFSFTYGPTGIDTARMNAAGGSATTNGENILPVYVAISSTDTVYTAVAAATDVTVDFEQQYQAAVNPTVVGTLVNNVGNLTVFADPASNRIISFTVTNNTGATGYMMMFANSAFTNGQLPLQQWKVANGARLDQFFGSEGWAPIQGDAALAYHTGCYLVGSSTTQTLTTVANGWSIQAKYI
jgi:hypothetical protein